MENVEEFLKRSDKLLGTPTQADMEALKGTLEALRKVSPDLIDSKIFERLSRLVDSVKIARDTQAKIDNLTKSVQNQQKKLDHLTTTIYAMNRTFNQLDTHLTVASETNRQLKQKQKLVLDMLEQWLRKHS